MGLVLILVFGIPILAVVLMVCGPVVVGLLCVAGVVFGFSLLSK